MNLTEYNAMPDGDLKLAVRTAVTMGWWPGYFWRFDNGFMVSQIAFKGKKQRWWRTVFNPFTDASIPYRLIGQGVDICGKCTEDGEFFAESFSSSDFHVYEKTLTHAILNAYCQADPMGHWAKFLKGE